MVRRRERDQRRAQNFINNQINYQDMGTSPIPQQNQNNQANNNNFDIKKIVFATLASGMTYLSAFTFLALLTGYVISKKNFYKAQSELEKILLKEKDKQLLKFQNLLEENTIVAFDGAWNHVRQGSSCIVTIINIKTKKIIDFAIIERPKQYVEGNCNTSPKNLEAEGIRTLASKWKNDKRIVSYVHDNDGSTRKILKELGWNINEYLDYGHSMKAVSRVVKNFVTKNPEFKEIEVSLEKWLMSILKSNYSSNIKLDLWINSYQHYNNCHDHCKHKNKILKNYTFSDKSIEKLKKFLKRTRAYGSKVNNQITSQAVESFNSFKSHYAQKSLKFATSTQIRYLIAALSWNDRTWAFDFVNEHIDSDNIMFYVKNIYKNLVIGNCKNYRCTREFKDLKNKKRNKERYKNKKDNSPYQYKGKKKKVKELFT